MDYEEQVILQLNEFVPVTIETPYHELVRHVEDLKTTQSFESKLASQKLQLIEERIEFWKKRKELRTVDVIKDIMKRVGFYSLFFSVEEQSLDEFKFNYLTRTIQT